MYLFVYNNEGKNIEMTYCLGMKIKEGLIFMSDTRTNSGVDNICLLYTSPSPRDVEESRMPSSA